MKETVLMKNKKQMVGPSWLATMNYSQRLVIYGVIGGLVLTFLSLLIANMALSNDLFYMGYFVMLNDVNAGPSVMTLRGFPFSFMSTSAIANMFGYFAFLVNFIIYVIVVIAVGLGIRKYR
jgi:hypothetical protein